MNSQGKGAHRAKRLSLGIALLSAFVTGCAAFSESPNLTVKVSDLVSNGAAFDGKLVTVAGRVSDVELHGGGRGARLGRVFNLNDGSQVVKVVSTVGPTCLEGSNGQRPVQPAERSG